MLGETGTPGGSSGGDPTSSTTDDPGSIELPATDTIAAASSDQAMSAPILILAFLGAAATFLVPGRRPRSNGADAR